VVAFAGIGGNLGDPSATIVAASRALARERGIRVCAASSVYRTPPVGPGDQPFYLNAVLELRVTLSPRELLGRFLDVERRHGRVRLEKWGPRTIDLDLLLYADRIIAEEGLKVPHPHLHERAFVLLPLCDLCPDGRHPSLATSFRALSRSADTTGIVRVEGLTLPVSGTP
jgi:2-amino-4-hydroxy-6-hydroxymethyldihydropteridine diphosphokinase